MNIIKRSGEEVAFEREKIVSAISRANETVEEAERLNSAKIEKMVNEIVQMCEVRGRALSVEEVQDLVESKIQQAGAYDVAKNYIKYRFIRELKRHANTTDQQILSSALILGTNSFSMRNSAEFLLSLSLSKSSLYLLNKQELQ